MTISGSKAASTREETQKRGQEDRRMNDVKSQREEPTAFIVFLIGTNCVDRRSASQMDFFPAKLSYRKAKKMAGVQRGARLTCEG